MTAAHADAPAFSARCRLAGAVATDAFARALAPRLGAGDTLLLGGPIGAGKTAFARALIGARGVAEDVPSPTFTLVQTYSADGLEIWHCDLYRVTQPDELLELGLDEAFEAALCLVEWPDRLGDLAPADALRLDFALIGGDPDARELTASGPARWSWVGTLMEEAPAHD